MRCEKLKQKGCWRHLLSCLAFAFGLVLGFLFDVVLGSASNTKQYCCYDTVLCPHSRRFCWCSTTRHWQKARLCCDSTAWCSHSTELCGDYTRESRCRCYGCWGVSKFMFSGPISIDFFVSVVSIDHCFWDQFVSELRSLGSLSVKS